MLQLNYLHPVFFDRPALRRRFWPLIAHQTPPKSARLGSILFCERCSPQLRSLLHSIVLSFLISSLSLVWCLAKLFGFHKINRMDQPEGCGYLWRITEDLRDQIPYGTTHFKLQYNRRTAVERAFSRLLAITLEEPSVRGLASIRNHCTISHIAVLLVAKAAHKFDSDDKIRFVRTFVPRFL